MNDTLKWDRRFLELAWDISEWSKDPSTKVGAVVVNDLGQIVGSGYNGFPRGVLDKESRYLDRDVKYKLIVHAELNAILMAGEKARDSTIYSTLRPCQECTKVILQSGIKRIVAPEASVDHYKRWGDSFAYSDLMCQEAGVEVKEVEFT